MKKMKTSTHNLMQEYEEKIRSARPGSTTKLRSTRLICPCHLQKQLSGVM